MADTVRRRTHTLRIPLDATLSHPGSTRGSWTAEAGYWRFSAATAKATTEGLTEALATFLANYLPPKVLAFRGYVAVLLLNLGDANPLFYQLTVDPRGRVQHSVHAADSWDVAEAQARRDLAHQSTDWHDDASVHAAAVYLAPNRKVAEGRYGPEALYTYTAWQRAAHNAHTRGLADWAQWADDHQADFTITPPATGI